MSSKKTEKSEHVDLSDLAAALASVRASRQQAKVGVRNISGSTVSLPAFAGEPDVTLHPYSQSDPNSVGIVSAARWAQLRKSGLYGQGLIERFDEVLDPADERAPEDRPELCHPDHAKNRLPDPVAFIEGTEEGAMRTHIMAMTSENQLLHIIGVVDKKMKDLERQFIAEGDPEASRRAIREIPMHYVAADQIAQQRLEQIRPSVVPRLPEGGRKS